MTIHDGRGARRLKPKHARQRVGLLRRVIFFVALPVGGDVSGVAHGEEMKVRRVAQRVTNFKRRRLLPLDAHGIDAVHDLDFAGLAEFTHDAQRLVEVAFNGNGRRAVHQGLREFAEGNVPVRQQHHAFHLRARRVSGGGGRGIAGAGADDDFRAALLGLRHGERHAAILERAGRVQAFVFEEQRKITTDGRHEIRHFDERRVALVQRDDGRLRRDRQIFGIAADDAGPVGLHGIRHFEIQVQGANNCGVWPARLEAGKQAAMK